MSGTRSERKREKTRKEKRAQLFTSTGVALGIAALGYVFIAPEPNVYLGSLFLLIALALLLFAFWEYFTFHPLLKLLAVLLVLAAFAWKDYRWVRYRLTPSFVFVVPGVWVNGDTWDFVIRHRGPETVYGVTITFMDEDRIHSFAQQPNGPLQTQLYFPEISPHKAGIAKQLLWKPLVPDHEHYQAIIESRKTIFSQILNVERINGRWVWETRITDADHGHKIILECKDADFPPSDEWKRTLPACFPDLIQN